MAEMDDAMQVQTEMVRRGENLREIFDDRCTSDCEGHRAGYLWAVDHAEPLDESACAPAKSKSFREGCEKGARAAAFE